MQWMRQPENEEEVLVLAYTAKDCYTSPSHYAFGDVRIPTQSQYEIDTFVSGKRREHEAELAREAAQRAASGRI